MALSESAIKKLHKDEIINLALDYQTKFDSMLAGIRNELSDLKQDFEQLISDLLITNLVSTSLKEKKLLASSKKHGAIVSTLDGSA